MNESARQGIEARGNRLRPWVWGGAAALLALPAIAMRFRASGVDWSATDFLVFGAMLAIACGLYELATRMSGDVRYRERRASRSRPDSSRSGPTSRSG